MLQLVPSTWFDVLPVLWWLISIASTRSLALPMDLPGPDPLQEVFNQGTSRITESARYPMSPQHTPRDISSPYGEFDEFIRNHIPHASVFSAPAESMEQLGWASSSVHSGDEIASFADLSAVRHSQANIPRQFLSSVSLPQFEFSPLSPASVPQLRSPSMYRHLDSHSPAAHLHTSSTMTRHLDIILPARSSAMVGDIRPLNEEERMIGLTQVANYVLDRFENDAGTKLSRTHVSLSSDINPNLQEFRELLRLNLFTLSKIYYKINDDFFVSKLSSRNPFYIRMVKPQNKGPVDRYMQAWKVQQLGDFVAIHYLGTIGAQSRKQLNAILNKLPAFGALDRFEWPHQTSYFVILKADLYRHPRR